VTSLSRYWVDAWGSIPVGEAFLPSPRSDRLCSPLGLKTNGRHRGVFASEKNSRTVKASEVMNA